MVAAALAHLAARLLRERSERRGRKQRAHAPRLRVFFAVQGSAEGAHQARDVGADHVSADLLLECAQYGFVVKRAALDNDLPAQLLG